MRMKSRAISAIAALLVLVFCFSAVAEFRYEHNPSDNPKVLEDAIENPNAVYGYSPRPDSGSLKEFADIIDWTNPEQVEFAKIVRTIYHMLNDNIYYLVEDMKKQGASAEEIGRAACKLRNENRLNSYLFDPEGLKACKARNLEKYGQEEGPTPEQIYEKVGSWEAVVESAYSSNPAMDACCGLYDEYYHTYGLE